jgi:hypothetical protein
MPNPQVAKMLEVSKLAPAAQHATLRGVADKMTIEKNHARGFRNSKHIAN